MHKGFRLIGLSLLAVCAPAQSDRGTITGTITDPGGAVIPNAPIEAKNLSTGLVCPTASTGTGNFTITELPASQYLVTANAPGFNTATVFSLPRQGTIVARITF